MAENCTMVHTEQEGERDEQISWEPVQLDRLPIVMLPIGSLVLDESPRQGGESDDHVGILAESDGQLPPIVVHGQSMRVIDGMHRTRAAILRGEEKIEARIYHGTEDDAFVVAVQLNIAHGLPLTRADRTAAAARIIGSHPRWSNRMIASATGLSAGTVGKMRQRSTVQNAQSTTRVGRDGRKRPLDNTVGRVRASQLLAEKPAASIRSIATEAGVSPSTVHDVRRRILSGQDPTVPRPRIPEPPAANLQPDDFPPRTRADTILANLKADPSLRFSDAGRFLIRWLDTYRVGMTGSTKIVELVPDHCAITVAKLARGYARVWTEIAAQLEQRGNCTGSAFVPAAHPIETQSKPG